MNNDIYQFIVRIRKNDSLKNHYLSQTNKIKA